MSTTIHHRILIIGGGSAGISVAARLRRAGIADAGLVEPSAKHYYRPRSTLLGGGRAPAQEAGRPEAAVVPQGVAWIKARAVDIDPENHLVTAAGGVRIAYDHLILSPGIQLDWHRVPGMAEALTTPAVSSNYSYELTPKTWERIRALRSGKIGRASCRERVESWVVGGVFEGRAGW